MRRKLLALAATLMVAASFRLPMRRRPPATAAETLLPGSMGPFRRVRSWRGFNGAALEIGAEYLDPAAGGVSLDLWLDASGPHNGVACFLVRGAQPMWQRLRRVRTRSGSAVFDTALFQEGNALSFIASTQCYAGTGCDERWLPTGGWVWPRIGFKTWFAPFESPVPVSIMLTNAAASGAGHAAEETKLVARFERFASMLDLSAVQRIAAGGAAR